MNKDYNVKIFHYSTGKQVRIYDNIIKKQKDEKDDTPKITIEKNPLLDKNVHSRNECDYKAKSVSRTINTVYEYTRSNTWEYFLTLTFNPEKVDSLDYAECVKHMSQWIKDFKRRHAPDFKYVFVPEQHKSGRWHFHALCANIGNMRLEDSGKLTENGDIIYNIDNYKKGWTTATKIKDSSRASSYITKYLTKDTENNIPKGCKRYWVSRNVNKPQVDEFLFSEKQKFDFKENLLDKCDLTYIKNVRSEFNNVTYMEIVRKK